MKIRTHPAYRQAGQLTKRTLRTNY